MITWRQILQEKKTKTKFKKFNNEALSLSLLHYFGKQIHTIISFHYFQFSCYFSHF